MNTTVACGECGLTLAEAPNASLGKREPCSRCGSLLRRFDVSLSESITIDEYLKTRHKRADADRSLPEKGVVRSESGTRVGRNGRRVRREALYDPYLDVARERVVDEETGEVIVDKTESMKAKYSAAGRWTPGTPEDSTPSS